jgi:hypothetical protein
VSNQDNRTSGTALRGFAQRKEAAQFFLRHEVLWISSVREPLILELHGCRMSPGLFEVQRLRPLFSLDGWFRRDGCGNLLRTEDVCEERLEHAVIEDAADSLPVH